MKLRTAKQQSLRERSAWLLAAKVIGFALSFALPLLIVRYLTQEQVGTYREAFQVITNAVIILPLGFSMSAYYFLAREESRRAAAILNILLFNFVVGGIACLVLYLYPQLIGNIFRSDELTRITPYIGLVVWIWIFSTFLETVAIANQEARTATIFIVFASFSKTLLMGGAVFAFATVESFIFAALVQGVVQSAILVHFLRTRFPGFWRQFDPRFFVEQMKYAIPFGLTGILWMAQNDIHNYFVGYKFSSAEYAIYAYGCFEVPLIAMLSESATAVLIPRMNELQLVNDRDEMIRLTVRAMQKLSFFYFPIYVFLLITSTTFITTIFTKNYEASVPIFMVNLTLLPFSVFITDPIVRSFKELGRLFLATRIVVLGVLVGVLYVGIGHFGLTGMITTAVGAIIVEKIVAEIMVIRKLGLGRKHIYLLSSIAKTAAVSAFAGFITYFAYSWFKAYVLGIGEDMAHLVVDDTKPVAISFISGSLVLLLSAAVFAPVYLLAANLLGLIDADEKKVVSDLFKRIFPRRGASALAAPRS